MRLAPAAETAARTRRPEGRARRTGPRRGSIAARGGRSCGGLAGVTAEALGAVVRIRILGRRRRKAGIAITAALGGELRIFESSALGERAARITLLGGCPGGAIARTAGSFIAAIV